MVHDLPRDPQRQRREDIDTIRAIACIALVSYHVVGAGRGVGMELPMEHWLHRLNEGLTPIRMPLFAFLSGLVFLPALDAVASGRRGLGSVLGAKARRLLIPMAVVGALFWLVRSALGRENAPFGDHLVFPYAHFWYLQASFAMMAALAVLTRFCGSRSLAAIFLGVLGGWAWIGGVRLPTELFSLNHALRLVPFFMAGLLVARWDGLSRRLPSRRAEIGLGFAGLGLALVLGYALALDHGPGTGPALTRGLEAMAGAAGILGLCLLRPNHARLAWLGRHSYAIYLFHVFFTAATLDLLSQDGGGATEAVRWLLALAAGLIGPVLVQRAASEMRWPGTLLLGLPMQRSPAPRPALG